MIAEPTMLMAIKFLSKQHNEDLYKSAYRLMKIGCECLKKEKATKN